MERDICVAKLGVPDIARGMETCGQECEYRTPERDGSRYTGWYHTNERQFFDHNAVPKRMIG